MHEITELLHLITNFNQKIGREKSKSIALWFKDTT